MDKGYPPERFKGFSAGDDAVVYRFRSIQVRKPRGLGPDGAATLPLVVETCVQVPWNVREFSRLRIHRVEQP